MSELQTVGIDIGRGYTKVYTEKDGVAHSDMFKSVVALGRELEWEKYSKPMFLDATLGEMNFKTVFCGELAEKEGFAPIKNSKDSKVTDTVKKLFLGALSCIPLEDKINVVLGVPNREWNKSNLNAVIEAYKGKTIEITDHANKRVKKTFINDITIFKESDAALLYHVQYNKPNNTNDNVMVNIGFRTTEISYYDNNLKYNDKKSKSLELGNQTVLEFVQKQHPKRTVEEIDSSNRYDELKEAGYNMLAENIDQLVESILVNLDEINLFACGGVVNKINLPEKFKKVEDPQMITAKGLFLVGEKMFKGGI